MTACIVGWSHTGVSMHALTAMQLAGTAGAGVADDASILQPRR